MTNRTQQIVNKAWSYAHVLRNDGLFYMAYTEQTRPNVAGFIDPNPSKTETNAGPDL